MAYRLLLADDDQALREVVREVCAPFFEILEAENGDEALEIAVAEHPELALCDFHMPGCSGLEALTALKTYDIRRPAILMTSDVSADLHQRVQLARIDSLLAKPFTRQQLLQTFATAIDSAYHDDRLTQRLRTPSRRDRLFPDET
ncbi:MAG: response regulator [Planctomycetaceae bacterium]|nr:response regulator [Planctomycetaceae bacterium]